MSRFARIDLPDTIYHIYTRANKGASLFLDDLDRHRFLGFLTRVKQKRPFELLSYCLMTTHYHLQLRILQDSLAKTMHLLNTLYAGWFNFRHRQFGHVFQNRYHSIIVDADGYLMNLNRYIHLNPVAANIVSAPVDYAWSSYQVYTGEKESDLISTDLVLGMFADNPIRQRQLYKEFVTEGIGLKPFIQENILRKTRILGSPEFVRRIQMRAGLLPIPKTPANAI